MHHGASDSACCLTLMHCDSYSADVAQRGTRQNGFAIRDFRLAAGLTIDQLAQAADVSAGHMRNIENEIRDAGPHHLAVIADTIGARVETLLRERPAGSDRTTLHNGFAIRDFRVRAGMTVVELAERVQISPPHLRNMENELRDASPVYLHRLAEVLQVRAASLVRDPAALTGEPSAQPAPPSFPPSGHRSGSQTIRSGGNTRAARVTGAPRQTGNRPTSSRTAEAVL